MKVYDLPKETVTSSLFEAKIAWRQRIVNLNVDQVDELYKASTQLRDLCWQEIKKRRGK